MIVSNTACIGEQVRAVRKAQGLTQPDLALIANVGIRFIVDLENGKETCQIGLSIRVTQALGIELDLRLPGRDPTEIDEATPDFEEDRGLHREK